MSSTYCLKKPSSCFVTFHQPTLSGGTIDTNQAWRRRSRSVGPLLPRSPRAPGCGPSYTSPCFRSVALPLPAVDGLPDSAESTADLLKVAFDGLAVACAGGDTAGEGPAGRSPAAVDHGPVPDRVPAARGPVGREAFVPAQQLASLWESTRAAAPARPLPLHAAAASWTARRRATSSPTCLFRKPYCCRTRSYEYTRNRLTAVCPRRRRSKHRRPRPRAMARHAAGVVGCCTWRSGARRRSDAIARAGKAIR